MREASCLLDLDHLASSPDSHSVSERTELPVEVPNPSSRKPIRVGKLLLDVNVKFGVATPSLPQAAICVAGLWVGCSHAP